MDSNQENTSNQTPEGTATAVSPTPATPESTPSTTVASTPEPTVTTPPAVAQHTHKSTVIAILIAAALLIGAGYYFYTTQYGKGDTVAVVNGKSIYLTEFNESVSLIEQNASLQGANIADATIKEEIRTQALNTLIDNALILTASVKAGFEVTDEAYKEKYDALITELGDEETLKARMAEIGLTQEKLEANIKERILADQYIESQTDVQSLTVTDAEVEEFIKALNAPEGELPPLEEIRPQIEAQILSQKQQEMILNLLEKLRSEGTIEKSI